MATLELTISSGYVQSWGVWEAIREILQNACDARDTHGGQVKVRYTAGGSLIIESTRGDITRDTLLLGRSSKQGDDTQRGEFGEGYKLAMLVLCRAGIKCRVHTQTESWTPSLGPSDKFGGADVVQVNVRPRPTRGNVKWIIDNLHPDSWETVQEMCLLLRKPEGEVFEVTNGRILRHPKYAGRLYVRGLYVCNMPDNHAWGYDLDSVKLDRDRKMSDPWSLRFAIAKAVESAFQRKHIDVEEMVDLFRRGTGEGIALREYDYMMHDTSQALATAFVSEHGDQAVPCTDIDQANTARQFGLKPVMVPEGQKVLLEARLGNFDSRLSSRGQDVARYVQLDDLDETQLDFVRRSSRLLSKHCDQKVNISIVEFVSDAVDGTHQVTSDGNSEVRIARRLLSNHQQFWATLIHEAAHIYGGDATAEHREAIELLSGRIIVGMLRGEA